MAGGFNIYRMLYSDGLGGLFESMERQRFIKTRDQMLNHLVQVYGRKVERMRFQYARFDQACGWDTYHVLVLFAGDKQEGIVGISSAPNF